MRYGRDFWQQLVSEVEQLKKAAASRPMLLPVVVRSVVAGSPAPSFIELQVGDLIIRVPTDTDVASVATLVAALRVWAGTP